MRSTSTQGFNYGTEYQRIITPSTTMANNNLKLNQHKLSLSQPKTVSLEPEEKKITTTTTTSNNNNNNSHNSSNNNSRKYLQRSPPLTPTSAKSIPIKTTITPVIVTPRQIENKTPTATTPVINKQLKENSLSVEDIEETPVIKLKESSTSSDDFSAINSPVQQQQQPPPPIAIPSLPTFQNDSSFDDHKYSEPSPVFSLKSQLSNNNHNNNSNSNIKSTNGDNYNNNSNIIQEDISSVMDDINDDNNDDYFGRSFE